VDRGAVNSLPDARAVFPSLTGMEGANILGHKLTVFYDSRDKQMIPLHGTYLNVSLDWNQNFEHRQPNQWLRTTIDARQLVPHASDRMVFVVHFLADTVNGRGIPFYERPTLGGENTLRAFGQSRFIDDTALLLNLEERIIVKEKKILDYLIDFELAPFLDMGRVLNRFRLDDLRTLQYNPGLGIRVLARPYVVGRLDVAYGRDGGNVFVGLDYPF
jgi:outer membrane protein assembly factor BamA